MWVGVGRKRNEPSEGIQGCLRRDGGLEGTRPRIGNQKKERKECIGGELRKVVV
jgi:hypothetical protein